MNIYFIYIANKLNLNVQKKKFFKNKKFNEL